MLGYWISCRDSYNVLPRISNVYHTADDERKMNGA